MQQTPAAQPKPKVARPKRVITEARKLQNREAQRAYRQRQKERLQKNRARTGEKGGSSWYQPLRPCPAPHNVGGEASSGPTLGGFGQSYILPDASKTPFWTPSNEHLPASQSIRSSSVNPNGGVGILELLLTNSTPNWSFNVDYLLAETNDQPFFPTSAEEVNDESAEHFTASTSKSASACTPQFSRQRHSPHFTSSMYLADPYQNRLQPSKTTLLSACLYNASTMGINIEEFFSLLHGTSETPIGSFGVVPSSARKPPADPPADPNPAPSTIRSRSDPKFKVKGNYTLSGRAAFS
ncbi:hypothetical protein KXW18_002590 [Aspergillus fumigatus]|nr:hypothetical protein KXV47_007059 [Aspergillus fumigatus]KAH3140932.1 hypothetical protein KXW18_002590 [Aspergillus fumigatus]